MASLRCIETPLAGLFVVERQKREDSRGFFSRFFCADELAAIGFTRPIAQMNHTLTARKGTVRGLHFQHPPCAEDKFVSCLKGEVFDVAIDLRKGSPTFLRWHAELLSPGNFRSLLIPQGFAHGFQTMTEDCELIYLHTRKYSPECEGALNARDETLRIAWPLPITDMSERDLNHAPIDAEFTGI